MNENTSVKINQSVAILIDGNNIELSLHNIVGKENALLDFNKVVPKLLDNRGLNRLIYFREGKSISSKLAERLLKDFHGSVMPCHKSADIPLTIKATQIAKKVDTIIIFSGDSDYVELVRHLRGEGVRVEIAAVKETTARILIEEADHFTPLTEEDCYILKSYRPKPTTKSESKPKAQKEVKAAPTKRKKAGSTAKKQAESKPKKVAASSNTPSSKAATSKRKKAANTSKTKANSKQEKEKKTAKQTTKGGAGKAKTNRRQKAIANATKKADTNSKVPAKAAKPKRSSTNNRRK